METAEIVLAVEAIYEEMRAGNVVAAGYLLEVLLGELRERAPEAKVGDVTLFREMARALKPGAP